MEDKRYSDSELCEILTRDISAMLVTFCYNPKESIILEKDLGQNGKVIVGIIKFNNYSEEDMKNCIEIAVSNFNFLKQHLKEKCFCSKDSPTSKSEARRRELVHR